jgi:magnesium chelatase family protein
MQLLKTNDAESERGELLTELNPMVWSRAAQQTTFPANFQLIGAMNPCPCGYYGDGTSKCHCTEDQIDRYKNKISGPLRCGDRLLLTSEICQ